MPVMIINDTVIENLASGEIRTVKDMLSESPGLYDAADPGGLNILMIASICGSREIVGLLLGKMHGRINAQDEEGNTALIHAAMAGNRAAVQSLLNYGANIWLKNNYGDNAQKAAKKNGFALISEMIKGHRTEKKASTAVVSGTESSALANFEAVDWEGGAEKKKSSGFFKYAVIAVMFIIAYSIISEDDGRSVTEKKSSRYSSVGTVKDSASSELPVSGRKKYSRVGESNAPTGKKLIDEIIAGRIDSARAMVVAGKGVSDVDGNGANPLMWAAYKGYADIVKSLVERGVSIDKKDRLGYTALSYSIVSSYTGIAKYLISKGAKVDSKTTDSTNLILAVGNSGDEMVSMLLGAGAKPDFASPAGDTPLVAAAYIGRASAAKLLIDAGADTGIRGIDMSTVLMRAVQYTESVELVKLLLEKKIPVDAFDAKLNTALMWAANNGFSGAAKALLEAGASVDAQNFEGYTALMFAAKGGRTETVKILCAAGADIDRVNKHMDTALNWAAYNGHYAVAKILSERGANPHVANERGYTAITLAEMGKNYSIANLLRGVKSEK